MGTIKAVIAIEQDRPRHLAGKDERLEVILSRHRPSFYRKAYQCLGNAADAEDAVQNALLSAYEHLDQFRGEAQLSTWLMAIVVNSARMLLRARLRHMHMFLDSGVAEDGISPLWELLPCDGPSPEDEFRVAQLRERVAQLTLELSPKLRRAFELRVASGLTIRETAKILGAPAGTVKARVARARAKLQRLARKSRRAVPLHTQLCPRAQRE
jgi:RNA polymerase sigma-70 factor, ECF subfamily